MTSVGGVGWAWKVGAVALRVTRFSADDCWLVLLPSFSSAVCDVSSEVIALSFAEEESVEIAGGFR